MKKTVSVIGLGYMGLPMALVISDAGHKVFGVDISSKKINLINSGKVPFEEEGLEELLKNNLNNNFQASLQVQESDIYIISVPTPQKDKKCDLSFVIAACEGLVPYIQNGALVIIESTVKPRTCEDIIMPIFTKAGKEIQLSHCPERAIPGNTLYELISNDRIIGGVSSLATTRTAEFYKTFIKGNLHLTTATTAECSKLMENTYRDVNIALANEFSEILEEYKVNPWEAIQIANNHPRVNIHSPGPGVGGHCIAVDPLFLCEGSSKAKLIKIAREINESRPEIIVRKALTFSEIHGKKVGILGVAYKKDVDDTRETPATPIIDLLLKNGLKVKVHDPYVQEYEHSLSSFDDLENWADFYLLLTDHQNFLELNINRPVLDTRNFFK